MSSESDDDDPDRTQPELPSVIVDPALLSADEGGAKADAEAGGKTPAPSSHPPAGSTPKPASPGPSGPAAHPASDHPAASEPAATVTSLPAPAQISTPPDRAEDGTSDAPRLSAQDADRFAASIRPSWEPPAPAADADAAPSVVIESGTSDDDEFAAASIAGRMSKTRAISLTAALIVCVGALIVFSVAGGETERPESWSDGPQTAEAAPTEATPTEAPPEQEAAAAAENPPAPPAPPPAPTPEVAAAPTEPVPPEGTADTAAAQAGAEATTQQVAALPPEPTPAPAPVEPVPVAPAPVKPAPKATPAPPARVRLRIATVPRTATLELDGRKVANPLDRMMAKGGKHRVVAMAKGHKTRSVSVTLDKSRTVTLELSRVQPKRVATTSGRKAPAKTKTSTSSKGAGFVADSPY